MNDHGVCLLLERDSLDFELSMSEDVEVTCGGETRRCVYVGQRFDFSFIPFVIMTFLIKPDV